MKSLFLSPTERPRERCLKNGPSTLSLRECIAVLLGSGPPGSGAMGVAGALLDRLAAGASESEQEIALFYALDHPGGALQDLPGLGEAGMARLLVTFEIARRYFILRQRPFEETGTTEPISTLYERAIQKIPKDFRFQTREWLGFVCLYRGNRLGEFCMVEHGVRTHVNVDPAELFARILTLRPRGLFLFHNHPSGSLNPSLSDQQLTDKVEALLHQFQIRLLGHAIVFGDQRRWFYLTPGSHGEEQDDLH